MPGRWPPVPDRRPAGHRRPIPADTIEYDNVPAGNNDVDLAVPQSLVRGTITILR